MGVSDFFKKKDTYQTYTPGKFSTSSSTDELKKEYDNWLGQDYKQFTWDGSMESASTKDAYNMYNALQQPEWNGMSRQGDWDNVINRITNMKDFSYDVNGDALYQQYKDQYTTQGNMAMMDTMGQAAALTGGYGNSYAQSVGQQTYQGYMQQLANKVPELYSLALSKYNSDKDDLYRQNDLYQNMFNNEYGMYQNELNQYNTNRSHYGEMYNAGRTFDYNTALAENDSYNSIISSNRTEFGNAYKDQYDIDWNKHTGEESLAAQAIQIYNNQLAQQKSDDLNQAQFDWQKEQSTLQAENEALKHQYVADPEAEDKVIKSILTEEEFKKKLFTRLNDDEKVGPLLPNNAFISNYQIDGKTYHNYGEYVKDVLNRAYNNGKGFSQKSLENLLEYYDQYL